MVERMISFYRFYVGNDTFVQQQEVNSKLRDLIKERKYQFFLISCFMRKKLNILLRSNNNFFLPRPRLSRTIPLYL